MRLEIKQKQETKFKKIIISRFQDPIGVHLY
jgi:hypothetical protein